MNEKPDKKIRRIRAVLAKVEEYTRRNNIAYGATWDDVRRQQLDDMNTLLYQLGEVIIAVIEAEDD